MPVRLDCSSADFAERFACFLLEAARCRPISRRRPRVIVDDVRARRCGPDRATARFASSISTPSFCVFPRPMIDAREGLQAGRLERAQIRPGPYRKLHLRQLASDGSLRRRFGWSWAGAGARSNRVVFMYWRYCAYPSSGLMNANRHGQRLAGVAPWGWWGCRRRTAAEPAGTGAAHLGGVSEIYRSAARRRWRRCLWHGNHQPGLPRSSPRHAYVASVNGWYSARSAST